MHTKTLVNALAIALLAGATVIGQDRRPLAIVNARILTMEGDDYERGSIVVRDGKIAALGGDVEIPAGARVIDAEGGTVMPGLVLPWSHVGLSRAQATPAPTRGRGRGRGRFRGRFGGRSSGPASNQAATKIGASIYARQDVFGELLGAGVTTLAVAPRGTGFPGQAALLNPAATDQASLAADEELYVAVSPANNTAAKELLQGELEKAAALVEERKKPKPAPEAEKQDEEKQDDGKAEEKKEEEQTPPETPPAENRSRRSRARGGSTRRGGQSSEEQKKHVEVLADLLEGKRSAFLTLSGATDTLHYLDAVGDRRYPTTIVATSANPSNGRFEQILDRIKSLKAAVLIQPDLSTVQYTSVLTNPAKILSDAGIEIGFTVGESPQQVKTLFYRLMEIVRHGLPADVALKAVTLVPAKMLKLDAEVGSIKVGKRADLLLFSGDPLDATTTLEQVIHMGQPVEKVGN